MLIEDSCSYEVEIKDGPLETVHYFYDDFKAAYYCYLKKCVNNADVKLVMSKRKTYLEKNILKNN